jgi:hypothetical protein
MTEKRHNIIRVQKQSNYTCVDNYFVNDTRLSLKAKGVMVFLLSKPNDWEVTVGGIESSCANGRDCVMGTLKELEGHGYLVREDAREGGKFNVVTTLYERPHTDPHFQRNTPSRENRNGLTVTVNPTLLSTEDQVLHTQPAAPSVAGKKKSKKKELSPERVEELLVQGEWFQYAKSRLSEKYPGYVFTGRQEKALALIFQRLCKKDPVKARAFLNCALADNRQFLSSQRHDPMYLYSHANEWLTASRQWSGFKPELPQHKAQRDDRLEAQKAEQERHRREAEELAGAEQAVAALAEGDREALRAAWLSTVPADHIFRSKWSECDWRNPAVLGGIYSALKQRQKINAGALS